MFRSAQSSLFDRKAVGGRRNDSLVEHHPPSPPDTESISSHLGSYATPQRRPSQPDSFLPTISAATRLTGPMTHSFSREFRGASRPQTRWLLVLLPPENLIKELQVGHRSPGKLSGGLLVPLFPTLSAQLGTIAKEFNLPSTTGLCLYLHLPDAPEAPRITDDVWPILWGRYLHSSDDSLPMGLPVAGRVQFDIDTTAARWYPMWFAHVSRKELVPELARTIPTSPRSPRGVVSTPSDATRVQKAPRPLALVPRQEPMPGVQIDSGPSPVPSPSKAVPPVANKETVEKVRRWSELVTPEPATLQPSPPAGESAVLPLNDSDTHATRSTTVGEPEIEPEPLNLDDFQWSITSAGPSSPGSFITTASSRVPSIHILERVEGSVVLTPTTATSWGPHYDSEVELEPELEPEWHVRSPDVGERAEGSVLLTPSTATSWGAPLSYPPTPAQWAAMHELVRSPDLGGARRGKSEWHALMDHIIRTPDLGRRAEGSVLLTPSTATTWGPPSVYPVTPEIARPREWVPSPGLGDREELTPGRVGRMSMMNWSTEVETEEQAYARMGLNWLDDSLLPGVREEEEQGEGEDEVESDYEQESLDDLQLVSVQHAVRSVRDSVLIQVTQEVHYDDTQSVAGSNDDVESLYDGHTFGREDEPERAFEFELELESPQLGGVVEEHRDITVVESSRVQEIHASRGLVVEDYDFEAEANHGQVEINFGETLGLAPDDASPVLDDRDSAVSIEGDVFEYAFDDSRAEPAFPVSVSTSEFPLSPAIDFDSPMVHSFISEPPAEAIAITTTVAADAIATFSVTQSLVSTPSYGAYPYLVIYPAVYPHLDLYPAAPATNMSRPTLALSTQSHHSPSPSIADSRVDSRSPASSRKSSLSIQVPTNRSRSRSRSIVAVNPADKRSVDWSKSLPPVPPVPRVVRDSSIGSIHNFSKKGSGSSLGSVQEVHAEEAVVTEERGRTEDKLPVPSPQPQPSSTAYPYRYPENLEQLYPSKQTTHYPTSLERIYPIIDKKARTTSSVATRSADTEPSTSNDSLATYSIQAYPVFNLYPAVYPHNLAEIYPALPYDSLSATPVSKTAPVPSVSPQVPVPAKPSPQQSQNVEMSGGYPFFDLYPAVYPHNLTCLYPSVLREAVVPKSIPVQAPQVHSPDTHRASSAVSAPPASTLDGYPFNLGNIYPPTSGRPEPGASVRSVATSSDVLLPKTEVLAMKSTRLAQEYPNIELYSPVYPYNLVIYPPVGIASKPGKLQPVEDRLVGNSPVWDEDLVQIGNTQTKVLPKKMRKTHAQLCTEVWRKTHAQLVTEVLDARLHKSHSELEVEVFPNSLPQAKVMSEVEPATPTLSITEALGEEAVPVTKPALEKLDLVLAPTPGPKSAPVPAVAALRRQRSGTIMRSSPTESLPTPPLSQAAGSEPGRSRSTVEARMQMFERTHTRSQTVGPQGPPPRTLVRQKSATFERAKSLFHTPEETKSEGSQTPPLRSVPMRRVSKLDVSKFGFA
ncbi:hypothetical protein OPQ81_004343 [Rhizoctonia solani]|nr:hypothetical protein OPQ81_004343 [Rhizoctonia solani]